MKARTPRALAATTIVLYWLVLLGGLFLYTAVREDDPKVADPLWFGALMGTILGQAFAMRNLRLWFVIVLLAGIAIWIGPFTPPNKAGLHFWMAFLPATLCGHASLSDRGSLFAFWFPSVIWMLSILDGTAGTLSFDTTSAALLGALAVLFVAFLFVREQRRVGLWRTVAPTPLAAPTPARLVKESPRLKLGPTGWALVTSAAAFVVTAWIAPRLWHVEQLTPQLFAFDATGPQIGTGPAIGAVNCRQRIEVEQPRVRVKEYFDLGRGNDDDLAVTVREVELPSCDQLLAMPSNGPQPYGYYDAYGRYHGDRDHDPGDPWMDGQHPWNGESYAGGAYNGSYDSYASPAPPSYTPPSYTPPSYTPPSYEPAPPAYEPRYEPRVEPPRDQPKYEPPKQPKYQQPKHEPPKDEQPKDERPRPKRAKPKHERPKLAHAKPDKPAPRYEPPKPVPMPDPEPKLAAPAPAPAIEPPPPVPPPPPATTEPAAAPTTVTTPSSSGVDLTVTSWLLIALAGALGLQLCLLGLRPVRRALTLRHIRKPFWSETIDQRISNWWHLVLVGLRDAGWRTDSGEAPRELAKRAGIDGVEQAATILERTRHGVGLDASDLADMREAAETAYTASRGTVTPFARWLGWFRRPLA